MYAFIKTKIFVKFIKIFGIPGSRFKFQITLYSKFEKNLCGESGAWGGSNEQKTKV